MKMTEKNKESESNGKKDWIDAVKIMVTPYMSGIVNYTIMD